MFVGVALKVTRDKDGKVTSVSKSSSVIGETREEVAQEVLEEGKNSSYYSYWPKGLVYTFPDQPGAAGKTTTEFYIGELTEKVTPPPPVITKADLKKK